MIKIVFKLCRNQNNAFQVQKLLQNQGLETGMLVSKKVAAVKDGQEINLPEIGSAYVYGILTSIVQNDDPLNSLKELLKIPSEVFDYYKLGLATSAVLLVVRCPEEQAQEIARLLREIDMAEFSPQRPFALASRMTSTNPLDEKMTGDFRRY